MGQVLPRSPAHHKSQPHFPSAKVHWLRCLPIPEPVFFAAYLQSGNPQELQAREAVRQEPPALAGGFFTRDFSFCCRFVFSPRLSACSGSLLESKLEKSSWNSPGEQKGFCAGGFGGRGCFLHVCFPGAKEHLPVAEQEVGWGGGGQRRGWALPGHRGCVGRGTDTSHTCQQRKSCTEGPRASQIFLHRGLSQPLCLALPLQQKAGRALLLRAAAAAAP